MMKVGQGFRCIFVASVFSLPFALNAAQENETRPVKVTQVLLGAGGGERLLAGEVRASERAALSFRVAGEIASINVSPGDEVKTGDLLATIDPAIYEQQRDVAKAQFELAKVLFERSSNLVEQGVVSRNDFDQSKSDYTVAQAALDKANSDLAYTRLLAPYDGVISKRYMREFEFAKQQAPVLGIQTESAIDVSFQLPEQFIGAVQRNSFDANGKAKVQVKFDSRDAWFDAKLKELTTVADPATGSYTVVLTLPMPEQLNVLPGMAATVKALLPASDSQNTFAVPEDAVVQEQDKTFVFVWDPTALIVKKTAVEIHNGGLVKGLNDGDWLVVAGAVELTDGQRAVRWIKERGL